MKRLWLILALLSAGCTVTPERLAVPDPQQAWTQRRGDLAQLTRWHLIGRIAIQSDDQAWQATLDWRQRQSHYTINIIGPLGAGSMRLDGDEAHAVLETDSGDKVSSVDPELLLYRQVGWRVPVGALRYWILGLPAPGPVTAQTLDSYGRLKTLWQSGWEIQFRDYGSHGDLELPVRIFVTNHRARVRLAIGNWELNPVGPSGEDQHG